MDVQGDLRKHRIGLLNHAHVAAMKQIVEKQQPFQPTVSGAVSFREWAKSKMEESEFNDLMSIMYNYKDPSSSNIKAVLTKIYSILKNYPEIKQAFGMFLPPTINLKFQTGFYAAAENFSVKNGEQPSESPSDMKPDSTSCMGMSGSKSKLKKRNTISAEYASAFLNKVEARFENDKERYGKFVQLLPSIRDSLKSDPPFETQLFEEMCKLFQDHGDLIEYFKAFVPNADYSCHTTNFGDMSVKASENLSDEEDEVTIEYSEVKDPSIANVYKYGSYEEHKFFDKVKNALGYKEVYNNFLHCLNLYNEDVVTNVELVKVCTSFLGRHPELLKKLKDMLGFEENGENYEIIPMRIVNMENKRSDPEIALDIDYATDGRNGASYRALSKDSEQPVCSGRTPLCKEVLNDVWVSFPSWSEDSTFVTSCKTQFEEIMYRCEDERFEMDMAIQSNTYAIQLLENIQKKISKMSAEDKTVMTLDDTLGGSSTVLYQRALHRLYGDKLEELLIGLKRNPVVAVPIILKRLRGKEEEWKEKQKEFNNHWRLQIDNYYLKSLDHQGINFKQTDCKSFRSKGILKEMEMVYAEKKENDGFDSSAPHFLLEFKDLTVLSDTLNLMCQNLKKLPGVYRNDRSRIEYLIRSFIPDFFGVPGTSKKEEDNATDNESVAECDDKMEVDQPPEERSGNTSPSENGTCVKGDVLSDQDGSNSVDENEMSDVSDKSSSFIEEVDVFDKRDSLQPVVKNAPYVLFFVSKAWFVFFRQFHFLCERLSKLLYESLKKDDEMKQEDGEEKIKHESKKQPAYSDLIGMLSQLLSGAIDYAEFEEEARGLFGIHAFVSFTMDKLINCIVRQLQLVVSDEFCKVCTSLFFAHMKNISDSPYLSLIEQSHIGADYLKKVEAELCDENCFQVVWHKKDQTLTIQLIEKEECDESIPDPCETERWSQYLESYVSPDSLSEDILPEGAGLPVFLPRNLKRQQEYWKRKVSIVEKLWKTRHSTSFLKKNSPYSLKRKAAILAKSLQSKTTRPSDKPVEDVKKPEPMETTSEVTDEPVPDLEMDKPNDEDVEINKHENKEINECEKDISENKNEEHTEVKNEENNEDENSTKDQVLLVDLNIEQKLEEEIISEETIVNDNYSESTKPKEECVLPENIEIKTEPVSPPPDVEEEDVNAQIHLESERASHILEAALETINVEEATEEIVAEHSEQSGMQKEEEMDTSSEIKMDSEFKVDEPSPRPKEHRVSGGTPRSRKRFAGSYIRRRTKKARIVQSMKERKKRQTLENEFDEVLFDYANFSALPAEEQYTYLALKSVRVADETEVSFKKGSYKMFFLQNKDTFIYRKNSLTKSKENHQQISEIKTSNFNAWHRIWMDRYLTPDMIKSCNSWFLKSDHHKYKVVCLTVTNCNKSPYIPYNKYKLKYYKVITID